MDDQQLREIILQEILFPSLSLLYKVDYDNIRFGVSERNICARLAHHMENIMRSYDERNRTGLFHAYYADVEYNRMGNGDLKHYENSEHRDAYMVSDLLIHSRGEPRNYLAVEMKRSRNPQKAKSDKDRLKSMVSSSCSYEEFTSRVRDTLVGAFIVYTKRGVQIDLFKNVDGQGTECGSVFFEYSLALGLRIL